MSKQPYSYDEDEFDALGADRVPEGVHRRPVPWWRRLLPFVVVLILAPILAFTVVQIWSRDGDTTADPAPTATAPVSGADPSDGASGEASGGADGASSDGGSENLSGDESDTSDGESSTDGDLDYDLSVWVLNGAGVSGLAGEVTSQLEDEGWANVVPDDYSHELPTDSAIFYTNADMADEAEAIGEQLGISALYEDAAASSNGVVVVLRADFS